MQVNFLSIGADCNPKILLDNDRFLSITLVLFDGRCLPNPSPIPKPGKPDGRSFSTNYDSTEKTHCRGRGEQEIPEKNSAL